MSTAPSVMNALEDANVDTDYFFHVVNVTIKSALTPLELSLVGTRPESATQLVRSMLESSLSFSLQALGLTSIDIIVLVDDALARIDVTFASNNPAHFSPAIGMSLN